MLWLKLLGVWLVPGVLLVSWLVASGWSPKDTLAGVIIPMIVMAVLWPLLFLVAHLSAKEHVVDAKESKLYRIRFGARPTAEVQKILDKRAYWGMWDRLISWRPNHE